MDGGRDLGDVLLEEAQGVGVGQHDPGHVVVETLAKGGHVDQTACVRRHGHGVVAAEGHRRRVGAVGRVRNDDLVTAAAVLGVPRPHEQEPGQLARCARRGLQGGGVHARDRAQDSFQVGQQRHPPLGEPRRGRRVDVGQSGQGGGVVADLRVVLHRARPERVGTQVDGVLAVAEPREMGDQVALGKLGDGRRRVAKVLSGDELLGRPLGQARRAERGRAPARLGQLEDRGLVGPPHDRGAARLPARRPCHFSTRSKASA